jgi:hypothetical protein
MNRPLLYLEHCVDCPNKIDPRSQRCKSCRTKYLWKIGKHRKIIPILDRFWSRVKMTNYCWEWTGRKDKDGYGIFCKTHGEAIRAHRFSYEFHKGLALGFLILHRCDNPSCINPQHLYKGNLFDNARDKSIRKRIHGTRNPNYRHGRMCK